MALGTRAKDHGRDFEVAGIKYNMILVILITFARKLALFGGFIFTTALAQMPGGSFHGFFTNVLDEFCAIMWAVGEVVAIASVTGEAAFSAQVIILGGA